MIRSKIVLFALFICTLSFTTFRPIHDYPQDYFRSPVDHQIYLSGTFGELRPNHFHAGIDIKSRDGKTGQPLYAIADCHVSRIKVSSGGYGKVLYFDHPNGYTSVFAHLDRFPPGVAEYVRDEQYKKESFELELFPNPNQFNFAKGDIVGWMGLSGRSFGPHLHFEIRDTKSEKPINPLLFGIKIQDNIAPKLHELKVYYLNDNRETVQTKTYKLYKAGRKYRIKGDTLTLGAKQVGFAIKAYDHMDRIGNWNGVYSIDMYNNDSLWYNTTMETFSFDETRCINAHLDYEEQVTKKSYFNRCFKLPGNGMTSIYRSHTEQGVVSLSKNRKAKITMQVKDADGNATDLDFWVRQGEIKEAEMPSFNYLLPYSEENVIDNGSMRLYFPKGAFYEDLYLQYQASFDESEDIFSTVHHIHNFKTPVHTYFDISINPHHVPEDKVDKLFIAYCDKSNKVTNCGGEWKNGMLTTKIRDLGDYCIMKDEVPPTIEPKRFAYNMRGYKKMTFKIKDDLPTARNVSGLEYMATVDDQWILLEFDAKNDLLTHRFDEKTSKGEHTFRLIVRDACGNETTFEKDFVY